MPRPVQQPRIPRVVCLDLKNAPSSMEMLAASWREKAVRS